MPIRRSLNRVLLPIALAAAACLALATVALAYPPPAATGSVTGGCSTVQQGSTCTFTFNFVNAQGQPVTGGVAGFATNCGSVTPTGTTDAAGNVTTVFTAGSCCSTATITATSGAATVNATTTVVCAAAAAPLPNTAASPPGTTTPLSYAGIGLALLVLVGGGITLRQTRRTG